MAIPFKPTESAPPPETLDEAFAGNSGEGLDFDIVSETVIIDDSGAKKESKATRAPKTKTPGKKVKMTAKVMANQLKAGHEIGALILKDKSWNISDSEAEQLAIAILDVLDQYDFNIDPKAAAWAKLIIVCFTVYGPKAYLKYLERHDRSK